MFAENTTHFYSARFFLCGSLNPRDAMLFTSLILLLGDYRLPFLVEVELIEID